MRPLGIFGGTFDPIHYGHLLPLEDVCRQLDLETVHFVPVARPGHRAQPVAGIAHRWRMVQLATAAYPRFVADDREIRREGVSYTVPTLESFRAEHGERPLCLVLGMDAFLDIPTWHRWREVLALTHVAVMRRPGCSAPQPLPQWWADAECPHGADLGMRPSGWIRALDVTRCDISATQVRQRLARGDDVSSQLPPEVHTYVLEHALYRSARKEVRSAL